MLNVTMDLKTRKGWKMGNPGFTLIEVMVAVTIALVLTGLVIANYNSHNDTQTLKQAGLTLKNNLRFAQVQAMSGEKPALNCTTLAGYSVQFSQKSYAVSASCSPEGAQGAIVTTKLPDNVIFDVTTPNVFVFDVLSRGTSLTAATPVTLDGFGKQYVIVVNTDGSIDDKGIQ